MKGRYALAVHGGVGMIAPRGVDQARYHMALHEALLCGDLILREGGSAVDAAVAAVASLENGPLFNAGRGTKLTAGAPHDLAAAIMDGCALGAGGMASVTAVRDPVRLAHEVLRSDCETLIGQGADRLAADGNGRGHCDFDSAIERLSQSPGLVHWDGRRTVPRHDFAETLAAPKSEHRATRSVGAVVLDLDGHVAAATSTSGLPEKRPGRVGDTLAAGAALYANSETCAVVVTGITDAFARGSVAYDIHARMTYGDEPLQLAAEVVVRRQLRLRGAVGGVVAIDTSGSICMPFTTVGMCRGWLRQGETAQTCIF